MLGPCLAFGFRVDCGHGALVGVMVSKSLPLGSCSIFAPSDFDRLG